jgi:cell division protein FtsB
MPRRRPSGSAAESEPVADAPSVDAPHPPTGSPEPTDDGIDLSLEGLGVVGVTRRRVAFLLGAIVATWIVIVFARQVGEAQAASTRASDMAAANAALSADVDALHRELDTIQQPAFVDQQARANGLGRPNERPFRLAPGAAPLAPDAPGSAVTRLGSTEHRQTPLESWLSLLLGDGQR